MELGQAVIAEVEIAGPVGLVGRPPRGADRPTYVLDSAVGGRAGDLFAGRMDDINAAPLLVNCSSPS